MRRTPLARTPFKRKNSTENIQSKAAQSHAQQAPVAILSIVTKPAKTAAFSNEFKGSFPKSQPVFRSESFRRLVTSLPCQHCGREGTQAAHRNFGKGLSLKTSDALCVSLCTDCHSRLDQGKDMERTERRAFWDDAYIRQMQYMIEEGMLK